MQYHHILLASHGTKGAEAAERAALGLCHAGAALHQLIVVPDFWKGMMGDDWLNNAATRIRYSDYVENELEEEIRQNVARMSKEAAARSIIYTSECALGKPAERLLHASRNGPYDLIVMGSPRPKGEPGLNSRMDYEMLARFLSLPLLIVPYPND